MSMPSMHTAVNKLALYIRMYMYEYIHIIYEDIFKKKHNLQTWHYKLDVCTDVYFVLKKSS